MAAVISVIATANGKENDGSPFKFVRRRFERYKTREMISNLSDQIISNDFISLCCRIVK